MIRECKNFFIVVYLVARHAAHLDQFAVQAAHIPSHPLKMESSLKLMKKQLASTLRQEKKNLFGNFSFQSKLGASCFRSKN